MLVLAPFSDIVYPISLLGLACLRFVGLKIPFQDFDRGLLHFC